MGKLDVPGASLFYEVRGSGPVLLLICGGIYDAAGYAGLADLLADRYTVVTYDRRGNSRSPLDGPPERQRVETHADDASLLLAEVADGPAHVFGNSSGAQIGLELAARHPEQVRALVAHEPPLLTLLPDADHWEAVMADVERAYRDGGAGPAMGTFGAALGMGGGEHEGSAEQASAEQQQPPSPEMLEMFARFEKNTEFFVGYEVPGFGRYTPDVDALRGSSVRIVPAAGEESAGEPPHRAALVLAERLGTSAEIYPGDHGGFGPHAAAFAARLAEAFPVE
ncbi:pimeloyl-ACP methyl ester carboxylesterase [Actinomadura coerulea]|uniref:Pimeloyl-ACP methyl ester carboxylesterase n=1 Tax=Actinomadura coerulea TaxID=46159 RepID=A0A7X0G5Q6_9ACTN|nr:alpha/beta fold hydrolase [Actinomadura coerulea]MBB6399674.1 pimeloyl-ACP methyl ester carboxylesterase [Actinomadura coerulea]GGQ12022.1 putative hydrolase YraK [Actinomadura coerulea]